MSEERNSLLQQLVEDCELHLENLAWVKQGVADDRGMKKIIRSRKTLEKAVDAYSRFSEEIEQLDFDEEDNEVWFAKWRELKAEISEIQARMEASVGIVAAEEEDAFASDDEDNDNPNAQGIAASLQMADDIKATIDKDIARLADILRVTEQLKELANHCLEELQTQRERLMAINAKLKAIDKKIEQAESVMEKIKLNMAANKCCWGIGCAIIWILVIGIIAAAVACTQGLCGTAVEDLQGLADDLSGVTEAAAVTGGRMLRGIADPDLSQDLDQALWLS